MPKTTDLRPGLAIGRYLLEAPIGEGGFGAVWRARSLAQPGKRFALKFALDPSYVRFLKKEGVLQLSLDHPSIVKMQEVHTEHDPPFVVMEYVEGHSLRHKLSEKGPLSIGDAENLLFHLLEVLEYTHARGVTHRDLKPENILIESKTGRIKLTDFGLGQTRGRYLSDLIVSKGLLSGSASAIAGTFAYQAPEARRREDSVDHRADLYALGVVLFEVLTGRIPAGLELPSELRRGVPRRLDRVFRLAYTANPEQRVPDARRMREAMTRTRGEKLAPILAAAVLAAPVLGLALSLYARTAPSPGGPPPASLVVHAAGPFGATAAASSAEPAPPSSASPSAAVASRSPVAAAPTPPRAHETRVAATPTQDAQAQDTEPDGTEQRALLERRYGEARRLGAEALRLLGGEAPGVPRYYAVSLGGEARRLYRGVFAAGFRSPPAQAELAALETRLIQERRALLQEARIDERAARWTEAHAKLALALGLAFEPADLATIGVRLERLETLLDQSAAVRPAHERAARGGATTAITDPPVLVMRARTEAGEIVREVTTSAAPDPAALHVRTSRGFHRPRNTGTTFVAHGVLASRGDLRDVTVSIRYLEAGGDIVHARTLEVPRMQKNRLYPFRDEVHDTALAGKIAKHTLVITYKGLSGEWVRLADEIP